MFFNSFDVCMMASFMLWTRRLLQIALSFETRFQSTENGSVPPFLLLLAHCAWRQNVTRRKKISLALNSYNCKANCYKTISDGCITVDFWIIKVHTSN